MLYLLYFVLGLVIPFIARRFGKILPTTMGAILFTLPHRPRFPHVHNPLQYANFRKKWRHLILYSICFGIIFMGLCYVAQIYLPRLIFPYAIGFIWVVLCAAETDKRFMILPDCLTLPLLLTGFLFAINTHALSPQHSIYGALFALLITTSAVFVLTCKKQTIFGAGDSKMAIALGSWLGFQGLNYTILTSFFLFVIYCFFTKKRMGAYGPALSLASLITFFVLYAK